jgi:hypothetical protein
MSPEQARGDEVIDYRSDIWSFCVVMYEAITANLPFDALNYNALSAPFSEHNPPTLLQLASADAKLSRSFEVGMTKDRAQRWRSINEIGVALAAWLKDAGRSRRQSSAARSTRSGSIGEATPRDARADRRSVRYRWPCSAGLGVAVTVRAPAGSITRRPGRRFRCGPRNAQLLAQLLEKKTIVVGGAALVVAFVTALLVFWLGAPEESSEGTGRSCRHGRRRTAGRGTSAFVPGARPRPRRGEERTTSTASAAPGEVGPEAPPRA